MQKNHVWVLTVISFVFNYYILKQQRFSSSGQPHEVYTGVVIYSQPSKASINDQPTVSSSGVISRAFHEVSKVYMSKVPNESWIDAYLACGESMDKAGAYGTQDVGSCLVDKIDGDFYNVVGLPLARLCRELVQIVDAS